MMYRMAMLFAVSEVEYVLLSHGICLGFVAKPGI